MNKIFQPKTIVWLCLLAGVIAVAAVIVSKQYQSGDSTTKPADFKLEQKDLDSSQLPDKFPTDLPLETGAKVTQNYNVTTTDGRFQATRTFESKKSLAENMKIYTDYAQKNSWKLGTAIDQESLKVVSAIKDNFAMTVTISESLGVNTVNITITQQAAAK